MLISQLLLNEFEQFFSQILLSVYPAYHKNIKFLAIVAMKFSSKKGQKSVLVGVIYQRGSLSVPQFLLKKKNFFALFFS
jgi:hypothetical protein